jgi:hypothetical protein
MAAPWALMRALAHSNSRHSTRRIGSTFLIGLAE